MRGREGLCAVGMEAVAFRTTAAAKAYATIFLVMMKKAREATGTDGGAEIRSGGRRFAVVHGDGRGCCSGAPPSADQTVREGICISWTVDPPLCEEGTFVGSCVARWRPAVCLDDAANKERVGRGLAWRPSEMGREAKQTSEEVREDRAVGPDLGDVRRRKAFADGVVGDNVG